MSFSALPLEILNHIFDPLIPNGWWITNDWSFYYQLEWNAHGLVQLRGVCKVFDTVISRLAFLNLDLRSVKEWRSLKGETASWLLYEKLKIGSVHLDGKSPKEEDTEELFSLRGYDLRKLASQLAIRYRGTETVNELLEWPHDLLYQHCLRNSVSVAAYSGDRPLLASFLDRGADMDIYDDYLGTPLYAAVCSKSAAVVELLLGCKTHPNTEGESGPPLTLAVRDGNKEIVRILTQHESLDVNAVDIKNYTPLWWSCTMGHIEIVRLLLKHKDVRITCNPTGGDLCLTWHSVYGGNPQMVQLLLDHSDTGPDDCKHAGETLLWWASRYGHASVVKLLLERTDVNPNAHMGEGSTLLWEAAVRGYSDTVRQFLQRKDLLPNILSYGGSTPLLAAIRGEHEDVVRLLLSCEAVDLNLKGESGMSPLLRAAKRGSMRIVDALLARKEIEVNSMSDDGDTALSLACSRRHEAVVRLLVAHKDILLNIKDKRGYLPIRKAADAGHAGIVQLLLGLHAARGDLQNSDHEDCLCDSLGWGSRRAVTILLNARVEPTFKQQVIETVLSHLRERMKNRADIEEFMEGVEGFNGYMWGTPRYFETHLL
ncbi:hspc200 [Aspergillus flavus]|nr:hspc200 [Aspergillus flavus]